MESSLKFYFAPFLNFNFVALILVTALSFVPVLAAEDIVDLRRKLPKPALIRGGTMNIENGRIDLHPPYVAHYIENKEGSFKFSVDVEFRDSTPRQTITGRIEVNLYREIGEYGSMNWELFWAGTREIGSHLRNPRLRDQYTGSFDSQVLVQEQPLSRYRVEMKTSTHGTKGRHKRMDYIFSVVKTVNQGKAESALGLLLSREASLVYRHFESVFYELSQKNIKRKMVRFALQRFHLALRKFNYLVNYLAANPLLEDRFAFGHALTKRARELASVTPVADHDLALPHYFVLDKQAIEAMRKIALDGLIDFEKASTASARIATAIEKFAYEQKWSVENLNYELFESERMLVIDKGSYTDSLVQASKEYNKIVGKLFWAPADSVPEQKYLRDIERKSKRFFNVPGYVASMEVTALRAIRAINSTTTGNRNFYHRK